MSASLMKSLLAKARNAGPYLLVELVMPGGTLIALALWLSRQYQLRRAAA